MTQTNAGGWSVHEWTGSAEEFHDREVSGPRSVWLCNVTSPALVLGSSQPDTDIDLEAASRSNLHVIRRRTGGGAVFLHPEQSTWIDVTIDRDDPLWVDDISASMTWLGGAFVKALSPWVNASVYSGRFDVGAGGLGRVVCFASSAPGEVFVDGKKLVGISQRRGRSGARFQCVVYRTWSPGEWTDLVANKDVSGRIGDLRVATVPRGPRDVLEALVASLPS